MCYTRKRASSKLRGGVQILWEEGAPKPNEQQGWTNDTRANFRAEVTLRWEVDSNAHLPKPRCMWSECRKSSLDHRTRGRGACDTRQSVGILLVWARFNPPPVGNSVLLLVSHSLIVRLVYGPRLALETYLDVLGVPQRPATPPRATCSLAGPRQVKVHSFAFYLASWQEVAVPRATAGACARVLSPPTCPGARKTLCNFR